MHVFALWKCPFNSSIGHPGCEIFNNGGSRSKISYLLLDTKENGKQSKDDTSQ